MKFTLGSSPYENKHFLLIMAFLWFCVPLMDFAGKIFIGEKFFAFRAWELAVKKNGDGDGPFHADFHFEKEIFGDLANMLKIFKFRQKRHQVFSTDSDGYRNPDFRESEKFPIVALGDSDMAGSSLSDWETYPYQLSQNIGVPVYNFSPKSPVSFLANERFLLHPPRILIWQAVERTILGRSYRPLYRIPLRAKITLPKARLGEDIKRPSPRLSEYVSKWIYHDFRWRMTGYHNPMVGHIDLDTGMLFYRTGMELLSLSSGERGLSHVLDGIQRIHDILRHRGIILVFMPLPDKENIYRSMLPNDDGIPVEPTFLVQLHRGLDLRGIPNINLLEAFLAGENEKPYLFFLDDTHWNREGVLTAVKASEKVIVPLLSK